MRTLIKNTMIISMDNHKVIQNGNILIKDSYIEDVFCGEVDPAIQNETTEIIDGSGLCSLPGFINTHTHVPMTLLRGVGEGKPLMKWLEEDIWPKEEKLKSNHIEAGANLAFLEMIKTGTTTFNDMYGHEEIIMKSALDFGIRGFLGSAIMGEEWKQQLEESDRIYDLIISGSYDRMINYTVAPHSPYMLSEDALRETASFARERNAMIHIHVCETKNEVEKIKSKFGINPVELLKRCGFFESKVLGAHSIYLTDKDIDIYKENGVSVLYNPQSNMKLASGVCPVMKYKEKGINIALGTDGTSSNNNLNMFEEMETGALLQKVYNEDSTICESFEMIKMATVNGARALGFKDLGKIKKGYLADIIMIDLNTPSMMPIKNVVSNTVFSANGSEVRNVIINGKLVMKDKKMLSVDEEKIIYEGNKNINQLV